MKPLRLRFKGILALVFILGLVTWTGYWTIRHFVAEAYCNTTTNSTLNRDQDPSLGEIRKAIFWDKHNAQYWHKLARALWKVRSDGQGTLSDEDNNKKQIEIISAFAEAVRLNPLEARYHVLLGWEYSYLWQDPDYNEKWLPAADICMERAAFFIGDQEPRLHVTIGNYWVMRSKTLLPSNPQWEIDWANASWHYKKAHTLGKTKDLKGEIEDFVWKFYPDKELIQGLFVSDLPK